MLDLESRIHFDEVERAIFVKEFHGPEIAVTEPGHGAGDEFADGGTLFGVECGTWRLLDDLLMAPLDRAVSFAKMNDAPLQVSGNLDFDVAGMFEELLDIEGTIPETDLGLALGPRVDGFQLGLVTHQTDASPATSGGGLQQDRIADLPGNVAGLGFIAYHAVGSRKDRDAQVPGRRARRHLVAHQVDMFASGTNEGDAVFLDNLGKPAVFRQETVTRMNCIRAGDFGSCQDRRDVQIAVTSRRRTDTHAFVGQPDMHGVGIDLGVNRHGPDAHLAAGTMNAKRYFAPVGDEHLVEHMLIR